MRYSKPLSSEKEWLDSSGLLLSAYCTYFTIGEVLNAREHKKKDKRALVAAFPVFYDFNDSVWFRSLKQLSFRTLKLNKADKLKTLR